MCPAVLTRPRWPYSQHMGHLDRQSVPWRVSLPAAVAGRDHPLRDPARRFLERARRGEVEICTSTEVLQEILYRYAGLQRIDLATAVYDPFVQLCPVVLPVTLADTDRARALLQASVGVSVRDVIHVS